MVKDIGTNSEKLVESQTFDPEEIVELVQRFEEKDFVFVVLRKMLSIGVP